MKRDCLRIEDLIWECSGSGTELPEDARRHVDGCPECARTLEAARRISPALRAGDRIPTAPDCRVGVMARISGAHRRRTWGYAWAGAAVVLIAAAVFGVMRLASRPAGPPAIVKKTPVAPKAERCFVVEQGVKPRKVVVAERGFGTEVPKHRERRLFGSGAGALLPKDKSRRQVARFGISADAQIPKHRVEPRMVAERADAERRYKELLRRRAEEAAAAESMRPVAAVVVSWEPSGGDTSYGYVSQDNDTGAITTCQVERVGNSINVRMEQTPPTNQLDQRRNRQ